MKFSVQSLQSKVYTTGMLPLMGEFKCHVTDKILIVILKSRVVIRE